MRAAPHSFRLRQATPADHPLYVRLFRELGVDDPPLDADVWSAHNVRDSWFLESAKGDVAGYGYLRFFVEDAHLVHLVVAAPWRGSGAADALMRALEGEARARGMKGWRLNVKADNAPALRLYARHGFALSHRSVSFRLPVENLPRLAASDSSAKLSIEVPSEEEDDELESWLDVPRGAIATYRKAGGDLHCVRSEEEDRALLGFARFIPSFGGCMPFRAERAGVARDLLDAVGSAHGLRHLTLVVDDDERLEGELRAAGAEERMRLAHLRAALGP